MSNQRIPQVPRIGAVLSILRLILPGFLIMIFLATSAPYVSGTSSPLHEPDEPAETPGKPPEWVYSAEGGTRTFGPVAVVLPSGFTEQGGATVIGNVIVKPVGIEDQANMIFGTEVALGIWPPNDQTIFQKPIQFRVALNFASIAPGDENQLAIAHYDPSSKSWVQLPTEFEKGSSQLLASLGTFTPVPRDFPEWGGRTFFVVLKSTGYTPSVTGQTAVVRQHANLRSGPGIQYRVIRTVAPNTVLTVIGRTPNGKWLKLDDNTWISTSLVTILPSQATPPSAEP